MIKLITGKKGTGKTKILIDEINEAVNASNGNIATVEKGSTIRYSISRKVRWCDTEYYNVESYETLYGFIAGLLASNSISSLSRLVKSLLSSRRGRITTMPITV